MFCVHCGAQNPDQGKFCHHCGKRFYATEADEGKSPIEHVAHLAEGSLPTPKGASSAKEARRNEQVWFNAYAWLFIATGVLLVIIWLSTKTTDKTIEFLAEGSLFCVTGVSVLEEAGIAIPLIWVAVAASALGVLYRGLKPIEILGWVLVLTLAIWYSRTSKREKNRRWISFPFTYTAVTLASLTLASAIHAYTNTTSQPDLLDKYLVKQPTPSGQPTESENPFTQLSGHRIYEGVDATVLRADISIMTPTWLINRCGEPLTEKIGDVESPIVGIVPERKMAYKSADGSVTLVTFIELGGGGWTLPEIRNDKEQYYPIENDADLNRVLSVLPCLGK